MDRCDVLIVGGGPAGSTCAWKLRAAGLDVVVLDKRPFPRDKTCAGWITPAVVEELALDAIGYAASRVFQPITGFRTGIIGGRVVRTDYGRPVSFGIRRCEFDHYLLDRAGARLRLGQRLDSIERSGDGWMINGSITTPLLVGAGGHFCPVARFLGAPGGGKELVVAAQEVEFEMTGRQQEECAVQAAIPELYFCPDLQGYGWCFRKGNFLNVGLGREDSRRLSEHVAAFCESLKEQGRIPRSTPEAFRGHAYLLYGHAPRNLLDDGVLLIGDAAGLAYAQSGEGIRPAVESGLIAAQVILGAAGDYRQDMLRPYADRLMQRFGKHEPAAGSPGPLPAGLKQWAAARLLATRWFSRHVLIDRWFLRANQPVLAGH